MIRRWLRRLVALGALGGAGWLAVKFLRGEPAPAFESAPRPLVPPPPRPAAAPASTPAPAVDEPAPIPEPAAAPAVPEQGRSSLVADLIEAPGEVEAEPKTDSGGAWLDAVAGEPGPDSHQVKAKLKSGIYHCPGMLNYDRTVPDRWYVDADAAEADGLRKAKR